jgi:hypothetical protein
MINQALSEMLMAGHGRPHWNEVSCSAVVAGVIIQRNQLYPDAPPMRMANAAWTRLTGIDRSRQQLCPALDCGVPLLDHFALERPAGDRHHQAAAGNRAEPRAAQLFQDHPQQRGGAAHHVQSRA